MTTVAKIREKGKALARELSTAGMDAQAYAKPPVRKDLMVMSTGNNAEVVRLWPGLAELEASVDSSHRQAVLNSHEEAREVVEYYAVYARWAHNAQPALVVPGAKISRKVVLRSDQWLAKAIKAEEKTDWKGEPIRRMSADRVAKLFDIRLPSGTELREDGTNTVVRITQTTTDTDTSFLVGMDETAHFICQLPTQVSTVDEAHDVLKPAEVKRTKADWKRQGEWFFVPVGNQSLIKQLNARITDAEFRPLEGGRRSGNGWWGGSSHQGLVLNYERKQYVLGTIMDRRKGHHKPLILPDWHRVIRNREVAVPEIERPRRWD